MPVRGGLCGAPLKARSLEVLRRLCARVGYTPDADRRRRHRDGRRRLERIRAGATLVQAYTGFIYGGPLWPRRLRRELSALLRARGFANVKDAVGRG